MQYYRVFAHLKSALLILISPRRKDYQPVLTKLLIAEQQNNRTTVISINCLPRLVLIFPEALYCKWKQQKEHTSTPTPTKSPCSPSVACSLHGVTLLSHRASEPLNLQLWDVVPVLQTGLMKLLAIGRQRVTDVVIQGIPFEALQHRKGTDQAWPFSRSNLRFELTAL